jgi:hypothetical protein
MYYTTVIDIARRTCNVHSTYFLRERERERERERQRQRLSKVTKTAQNTELTAGLQETVMDKIYIK